MDIDLSPELEDRILEKVRSGQFSTAKEVVFEALRLMDERDKLLQLRRDEMREEIAAGLASLRAGRSVDGEAVFERIEAELDSIEPSRGVRRHHLLLLPRSALECLKFGNSPATPA